MHSYITISHQIMQALNSILPLEFKVYCYLKSSSINGILCRTYKRITSDLGISSSSAQKAVKGLCGKGLIYKKNRYGCKGYIANIYIFPEEKTGYYTRIPREYIRQNLKATEFMTLCYLAYKRGGKEESYPSYNQMAADTGLSRRTLINAVKVLKQSDLLTVLERFYVSCKTLCITRARRSNAYKKFTKTVYMVKTAIKHSKQPIIPVQKAALKQPKRPGFFILKVGWCKICQTVVKFTNLFREKKKKIVLPKSDKLFNNTESI